MQIVDRDLAGIFFPDYPVVLQCTKFRRNLLYKATGYISNLERRTTMLDSIQIEKYGLGEKDMMVAAMVKGYLSMNPEALRKIVKTQDGPQYRIDGSELAT